MKVYTINILLGKEDVFKIPIDYDFKLLNPVSIISNFDMYNGVAKEKIYFADSELTKPLVKILQNDLIINGKPAIKKEFFFALHIAPLQENETIEDLRKRFIFDDYPFVPNIEFLVFNNFEGKEQKELFYDEMRKRVDFIIKYLYQQCYELDAFLTSIGQSGKAIAVQSLDIIFKKFYVEKEIWTTQAKGLPLIQAIENFKNGSSTTQESQILKAFLNAPTERAISGKIPNETVFDYLKLFIKNNYFNYDSD